MATTYTKVLKTIVVKTVGGTTINAADTATDPIASDALSQFEAFKTMNIRTANGVTLVPFHAVDNIAVTTSTSSVTRPDPYGCDENADEGGEGGEDEGGGK